jgi:hypothetical protein
LIDTLIFDINERFLHSNLQTEISLVRKHLCSSFGDTELTQSGSDTTETGAITNRSSSNPSPPIPIHKKSTGTSQNSDLESKLLEIAEQELLDEMVVHEDVEYVSFEEGLGSIQEEIIREKSKNGALFSLNISRLCNHRLNLPPACH